MNLPASLFGMAWHGVSLALAAPVLYQVWRRAPWARLKDPAQLNLLLGLAVTLALAWSMRAGIKPGLDLHLLGAMLAVLCLGARLALVAMALALTAITLTGVQDWQAWPLNFLVMAVAPALVAHGIQRWVARHLPEHFFVFVFVVGFAGSAVILVFQGVIACAVMAFAGVYEPGFLIDDYLPYLLMMGFSEAWLSGALVTLMVVYRPEWVAAFDDRRYLLNK
ncbi:MAG: energy-coupling factor ABC transporter permease [Azoarcus sp.]|jgi:uncharacterized membrane protein|nr:energy-coupling factor ABC transporter permease [Azoarcus sp.]